MPLFSSFSYFFIVSQGDNTPTPSRLGPALCLEGWSLLSSPRCLQTTSCHLHGPKRQREEVLRPGALLAAHVSTALLGTDTENQALQ